MGLLVAIVTENTIHFIIIISVIVTFQIKASCPLCLAMNSLSEYNNHSRRSKFKKLYK